MRLLTRIAAKIKNILKRIFPRLSSAYTILRDRSPGYKQPRETSMGFKFIGNTSMESGTFEPGETKVFTNILSSVDVVINVGYYCCIALSKNKRVVAFEPMVENIQYLMRNVTANGWESNIEIFPIALSNKVGVVDIYGGGTGASIINGWAGMSEQYSSYVPSSTLDLVLGSRFDGEKCLVMVDVEGAERLMLDGSSLLLDMEPRPIWLMEILVSAHQPKDQRINPNLLSTFQEFWDRGYEAWTTHKQNRIVTKDEIESIIAGGEDTIWGDTFLFIQEGQDVESTKSEYFN